MYNTWKDSLEQEYSELYTILTEKGMKAAVEYILDVEYRDDDDYDDEAFDAYNNTTWAWCVAYLEYVEKGKTSFLPDELQYISNRGGALLSFKERYSTRRFILDNDSEFENFVRTW